VSVNGSCSVAPSQKSPPPVEIFMFSHSLGVHMSSPPSFVSGKLKRVPSPAFTSYFSFLLSSLRPKKVNFFNLQPPPAFSRRQLYTSSPTIHADVLSLNNIPPLPKGPVSGSLHRTGQNFPPKPPIPPKAFHSRPAPLNFGPYQYLLFRTRVVPGPPLALAARTHDPCTLSFSLLPPF